jgi:hypothetical protein
MDAAGVPHEELKALEQLCSVANAPVFGTEEEQLGYGIIGGSLTSGRALGLETARLAARILRGEPPGSMAPPSIIVPGPPMFDWRQLERWQVSESRLPPGSVVRFREPSVWQRYHWYILTAMGIMIAQAATILGLVLQRARRRAAEAAAHELAGRLISIQEKSVGHRGQVARWAGSGFVGYRQPGPVEPQPGREPTRHGDAAQRDRPDRKASRSTSPADGAQSSPRA